MIVDEIAAIDSKTRDRGRTEAGIVAAARAVLADAGFQGFGVNAVARRAGCDKQLIYRYFGGIDGLVEAIGGDLAGWLSDRLIGAAPPADYRGLVEQLVLGFLDALRDDVLVQRIIAWELADPSPLVSRLAAARSVALGRWFAAAKGDLVPPPGIDGAAINTLLIGAVQQLVLSASASGVFAGVPLASDADWTRMRAAMLVIIAGVYGDG